MGRSREFENEIGLKGSCFSRDRLERRKNLGITGGEHSRPALKLITDCSLSFVISLYFFHLFVGLFLFCFVLVWFFLVGDVGSFVVCLFYHFAFSQCLLLSTDYFLALSFKPLVSVSYFLFQLLNCFHPFLSSLAEGGDRHEKVWMKEINQQGSRFHSFMKRHPEVTCVVKHSCNGKCCGSEETCGMLSLQWSILEGGLLFFGGRMFFHCSGMLSHPRLGGT